MKGIYLTQEGKKEIEAKIAELENDSIFKQWKYDVKTHNGHSPQQRKAKELLEARINELEEILSSATMLPVEESWLDSLHKGGKLMIEHVKETNGKPIKGPFDLAFPNGVIIQPKQ